MSIAWTAERIAELERRWEAGETASQIGHSMGVSRSAITGKAHRLGLEGRPSPINRTGERKATPAKVRRKTIQKATGAPKAEPSGLAPPKRISLPDERLGRGKCQWIDGLPSADDSCKCLAPALRGRPYCPDHESRAWIKPGRTTGRPFDPNLIGYVSRPPKPSKAGSGYLSAERRKGLGIG